MIEKPFTTRTEYLYDLYDLHDMYDLYDLLPQQFVIYIFQVR